jgi:hypothetical protein
MTNAAALDPTGEYGGINVSNIALSDDDFLATFTGAGGIAQIAGNNPLSSGLVYFEATFSGTAINNFSQFAVGVISTDWTQSGSGAGGTVVLNYSLQGCAIVFYEGNWYLNVNGSSSAQINLGAYVSGTNTVRLALNLNTKKAYGAIGSNAWNANGSADPVAGIGGADISGITFPVVPVLAAQNVTFEPLVAMLNTGPFTQYAALSGYGGWPATGSTPLPNAQVEITGVSATSTAAVQITWSAASGSVYDGLAYVLDAGPAQPCTGGIDGANGVALGPTISNYGLHNIALQSPDNGGYHTSTVDFIVGPSSGGSIILSASGTLPGGSVGTGNLVLDFSESVPEIEFVISMNAIESIFHIYYWFLDQNGNHFNGSEFSYTELGAIPQPAIGVIGVIEGQAGEDFNINVTGPNATVYGTYGISNANGTTATLNYTVSCNGTTVSATYTTGTTATLLSALSIEPNYYPDQEQFAYGALIQAPAPPPPETLTLTSASYTPGQLILDGESINAVLTGLDISTDGGTSFVPATNPGISGSSYSATLAGTLTGTHVFQTKDPSTGVLSNTLTQGVGTTKFLCWNGISR